jgi:DDE family transposase
VPAHRPIPGDSPVGSLLIPYRLISHQAIVNLIAATTTRTGLIVKAALDTHHSETAIQVSDEDLARLQLTPHDFHGDWNYTISPRR